jgi:ParB-like chromosome segregation protein Spo0J
MRFSKIQIDDIDFQDKTFDTTYVRIIEDLITSIKRSELINPLILLEENNLKFKIVSGFSRAIACRELKIVELPAFIYSESEKNMKDLFLLKLEDNRFTRIYNPVEISIIIKKLKEKFNASDEEIVKDFLHLLGLEGSLRDIEQYIIIESYDETLKQALIRETITLDTVSSLSKLSRIESEALLKCLEALNTTASYQKIIIELIDDISTKDNIPIQRILERDELDEILKNEKLPRSQKCQRFIEILKIMLYPIYTKADVKFRDIKKNMKLPKSVHLDHSPFFESPEFSMRFNFKNKEEIENIVNGLKEILSKESLQEIFGIIDKLEGEVAS